MIKGVMVRLSIAISADTIHKTKVSIPLDVL